MLWHLSTVGDAGWPCQFVRRLRLALGQGDDQSLLGQPPERLVEDHLRHAGLVDVDLTEQSLVELLAAGFVQLSVELASVLQQIEGDAQMVLGKLVVGTGAGDQPLGVGLLAGQGVLAGLQVGHRDSLGQVGVDQLLALAFQSLEPPLLGVEQGGALAPLLGQLFGDGPADGRHQVRSELDGPPVAVEIAGGLVHGQERQIADGPLLVATEAVEVGVGTAPPGREADAQSGAAAVAEDAALQVVPVLPGPVTGMAAGHQQLLHPVPEFGGDQGLVLARVGHAVVYHLAPVVTAAQDAVHLAAGQRRTGEAGAWPALQSPALQLGHQVSDRPVAVSVGFEQPADMRRPFRIEHDGLDFLAVDPGGAVEVAERGVAVGAAALDHLADALLGLGAQVLAVELGNGGHDAVQQRTGRRVVDLLGGRHQHGPGLVDGQADGDVVVTVSGQTVDLVDDDVVGVTFGEQPLQQRLQRRPVRRASRGPGVDELIDHRGAQFGRLAATGVPLGRDGVALGLAALAGLAGGTDSQIQQGPLGALVLILVPRPSHLRGNRVVSHGCGHSGTPFSRGAKANRARRS